MNTANNKRRKASRARIEKVFVELMQTRELHEITVTEICKLAKVNRTTFYVNYDDIYDLSEKVLQTLMSQMENLHYEEISTGYYRNDFRKILQHIYENQLFYKTVFKLGINRLPADRYDAEYAARYFQSEYIPYHIEFFRAGFNRVVELWLAGGCKETPEEIDSVIRSEYQHR